MNAIIKQDVREFVNSFPFKENLVNSAFLITGATGLIGSAIIRCLLALDVSIKIYAPVRNIAKAHALFGKNNNLFLVEMDLTSLDYLDLPAVDYVIHGAGPTASKFFVEKPVETINTILLTTDRILAYAAKNRVKSFVFLSSLEVYGQFLEEISVTESIQGVVDINDVRSSYPLAKRLAENLCCGYATEYGVPAKIARLTQTTGPGISKDDNRVIAQFVRCASENRDIILHTDGQSARSYCYITDAVEAILYILLHGEVGMSYNVANDESYISAKNLAKKVLYLLNPNLEIKIQLNNEMGYAPNTFLRLSTASLRALGWRPRYSLEMIILNLFKYLTNQ